MDSNAMVTTVDGFFQKGAPQKMVPLKTRLVRFKIFGGLTVESLKEKRV